MDSRSIGMYFVKHKEGLRVNRHTDCYARPSLLIDFLGKREIEIFAIKVICY